MYEYSDVEIHKNVSKALNMGPREILIFLTSKSIVVETHKKLFTVLNIGPTAIVIWFLKST